MLRSATRHRFAVVAGLLAVPFAAPFAACAQTQPPHPVVFDDFTYANRTALLSPVQWTNLDGEPVGRPERVWYVGNWDDLGAGGERITVERPSHLRLQSFPGDSTVYGQPYGPPWLTSGFTRRTGTWVARVRLADLTLPGTPLMSQAFWITSPHYASYTDAWDRRHASELNFEWNNYFYTPRTNPDDPATARSLDQMMSNGVSIDGECNGTTCTYSMGATGGYFMANPRVPNAPGLTCYRTARGRRTDVSDPETCVNAFVRRPRDGDGHREVDLMIQYDGLDLTWAAAVRDLGRPGEADDVGHYMERKVRLGRRAQTMAAIFSQIVANRGFCARTGHPESACIVQAPIGFSADWFLYSPSTTMTVWDAARYATWMQGEGLHNVNTAGLRLSPPAAQPPRTLTLEAPVGLRARSVREWVVAPPAAWDTPPGTWYDLSYRVSWRHRSQRTRPDAWTPWSPWTVGGFTARPVPYNFYRTEVEVEVLDWHGPPGVQPMRACVGTAEGTSAYACTPGR